MSKKLLIHTVDKDAEVRTPSIEIEHPETAAAQMQDFFDQMIEAMIRYDGIGIAAPQLGHCIQVIVIAKEYSPDHLHQILINPRIVSTSDRLTTLDQGCLSVPGTYGPVIRPSKVRVKAFDRNGKPVDIKAKGMYAQILQHEIDHLDGTLFIDKAEFLTSKG